MTEAPIAELPDPAWLSATSERTGIPDRSLAAYAGAALHVSQVRPRCGLGWNTLAAIGYVESAHGTFAGARTAPSGHVEPPIIGVPLDGRPGVMAIPDTDDGQLDGDQQWDRAVGPLQFIPTTWDRWGRDGDRDGHSDPHHVDDAALSAAVYLCSSGGDLDDDDGWGEAITAYNQSRSYVEAVAEAAVSYAG